MNISAVYDQLARIATNEFGDLVLQTRLLYLDTGDPLKLRLDIVDQSVLDVWLSGSGRYSCHWERRHTGQGDLSVRQCAAQTLAAFELFSAPLSQWRGKRRD